MTNHRGRLFFVCNQWFGTLDGVCFTVFALLRGHNCYPNKIVVDCSPPCPSCMSELFSLTKRSVLKVGPWGCIGVFLAPDGSLHARKRTELMVEEKVRIKRIKVWKLG